MKAAFFQYLNKKIGQYLYGFKEESLNLGLMQGKFELRQLTLKPIEVNKLIKKELDIPFQIKAGLISKILVEYGSILQLSNVKIQIDELMIVLKPAYNSIKSGADYYESQTLMDLLTKNYNQNQSAINTVDKSIFKTFRLKKLINQIQDGLKRIRGNSSKVSINQTTVEENKSNIKSEEKGIFEKAIEEKLKEMLEKLKIQSSLLIQFQCPYYLQLLKQISINKIHIRFEDSDISFQNPLAIGLLIENLLLLPQKKEVLSMINAKLVNLSADQISQNREQIKWLKFLQITDLTLYIKNKSEQAIPDTLLREVAYQNLGILEAISFDDLRNFLINQFFQTNNDLHIFKILQISLIKCNYLHTTSPKPNNNQQQNTKNMMTSQSQIQFINSQLANMQNNYFIQMSITQPQFVINKEHFITLKDITKFLQNQTYWPYLQKFKPKLRPFLNEYNQIKTPLQKRVNTLIIRDWFRVIIWKHRLQKTQQENYPEIYKKYQLTSVLYSLEYPQLMNIKVKMTSFGQLFTFFNENLSKELSDEIEMLQNMKESEKKSMQLLEELKESTFTFVFKVSKFEIYFIDKSYRFLTSYFNLIYFELSNKYNEQLFFFDLSPICVYLHGGDRLIKVNKEQQKQQNNSIHENCNFQELAPFQPRTIYDKRHLKEKNNESFVSQGRDGEQKKNPQRKIFENHNGSNYGTKQAIFTSYDGLPSYLVNQSLTNNQFPQSQQPTRRSNQDLVQYQFDTHSDKQIKYSNQQEIEQNISKGEHQISNYQHNNSEMQFSSPQSKKRKQIFEHDFNIQNEFFDNKAQKENNEKNKTDLNLVIKQAKDRRDLIETKSNCVIKFQTISQKNEVNVNVQLPEIKINQDTRDLKEILNYFQEYPIREFINLIAECFLNKNYQKITNIVRKAATLKKKQNQNTQQSTLQFSTINRVPANIIKGSKQSEQIPKINIKDFNIESNQKDGLLQFDDEDEDQGVDNKKQNEGLYTNPDPDLIDLEDLRDSAELQFPKEYQSLLLDNNRNNLNSRLEAIIEDPNEIAQTTYKSYTKATNLQYDDIEISKGLNQFGRESKTNGRSSLTRQQIQLYHIFNYYLYQKITGSNRSKEKQKEKKIELIDIFDEYIAQRHFNICVSVGQVNLDAKDHFSQDENENVISVQIPAGQIIINFNSTLNNRHLIDIYHFKMSTTSKFKIIKYMINRIKKMIDVSELFQKEDEYFDLDL